MVMRRGSLAGHGRYRPKVLLVEPSLQPESTGQKLKPVSSQSKPKLAQAHH